MNLAIGRAAATPRSLWAVTGSDRLLAALAALLLAVVCVALARGRPHWADVPAIVWFHIATVAVALALTPAMLLRPRGDQMHRRLGYGWVAAIGLTALASFFVRMQNPGQLSFIHILSAWTLFQITLIVRSARAHDVQRHRRAVRGMVVGALLIAGVFTFPFGRMMGDWLFG